jgi:group I intron endonuclease
MTVLRFTIYCHTNRVNGKRYVGQTVYTMEKRWGDHVSTAKGGKVGPPAFTRAIRKYGADAFDHQILEVVETQEAADAAESLWIERLACCVPNGYNLKSGGRSHGQHDDTKRLIGEASRVWWGKLTPEERSARQKSFWSPERTARAKLFQVSEETRAKISAATAKRLAKMTPEQRAERLATNIHIWSPERRARLSVRCKSKGVREKVSSSQKALWSKLTAEEKSARVRHQLAGMSAEAKSERVRKAWGSVTPEARAERVRKAQEGRRKAKEARDSRFVRINLLRAI